MIRLHQPQPPSFADLAREIRAAGFAPGFPVKLTSASAAADLEAVEGLRCPACRARRMEAHPFKAVCGYKVLARCPRCGAGVEM
jgi:hypothetical protein